MSAAALQLDLFGEVEAAEHAAERADRERRRDALTCLIEAHPRTLELLLGDLRHEGGEIKQGVSGGWAYSVRANGFWFQDRDEWSRGGGWYQRPKSRFSWDERAAIAADPRVEQVRAWSAALTAPDSWKDRYRPFELWPHPETWHPSYITSDHERPGWVERRAAWDLVLAVLTDAREEL